jgi:hypothetical protein
MNAQVRCLRLEGGGFAKAAIFFLPPFGKFPQCSHAPRSVTHRVDTGEYLIELATSEALGGEFLDRPDDLVPAFTTYNTIVSDDVLAPPANPTVTTTFNISTLVPSTGQRASFMLAWPLHLARHSTL